MLHLMAIRQKSREGLCNWLMTRVNSEMKESVLSCIIFPIVKVLQYIYNILIYVVCDRHSLLHRVKKLCFLI